MRTCVRHCKPFKNFVSYKKEAFRRIGRNGMRTGIALPQPLLLFLSLIKRNEIVWKDTFSSLGTGRMEKY